MVIDAIEKYYSEYNANIHRGVHTLSQLATDAYEVARNTIQNHINAKHNHEIIFYIRNYVWNQFGSSWFCKYLKSGDEVMVSALEHHSNIVPWQFYVKKQEQSWSSIP